MDETHSAVEEDRRRLLEAEHRGRLATLITFFKLSGPGWMQSALTLGGGSLSSSLYLGILAGVGMLWLQPFAMLLGVIMLSAISYITLSTGQRPFGLINQHISPVLGWGWILGTLIANMVWSLPQYSICFSVFEQNLFPGLFQGDGPLAGGGEAPKWIFSIVILAFCTVITWSYGSGNRGIAIYEKLLKGVVALIVLCFMGVVARIAWSGDGISLRAVLAGLIPHGFQFFRPEETWQPLLQAISDPSAREYWSHLIITKQRDVMLSAGAAAVGINMTFMMPYSLLARGWDRAFRSLTVFDLLTGMFVPFILATGCIVIASASRFHAQAPEGFTITSSEVEPPEHFRTQFDQLLAGRENAVASSTSGISLSEKKLAAALVNRDSQDLARSLELLFSQDGRRGSFFANIVFGIGAAGMTLSSITLLMLTSGLVVCEIAGRPPRGWLFRLGCMISATGILWPLIWTGRVKAYLAIPAGVICVTLLPIAYISFYLMMNNKVLMGDAMPKGGKRWVCNIAMGIAVAAATAASISAIVTKVTEWIG